MSDLNFTRIKNMYRKSFDKHGESTHALLTPKGRQDERFGTVIEYLERGDKILDFGCGLSYLHRYLRHQKFSYHGVDMSSDY